MIRHGSPKDSARRVCSIIPARTCLTGIAALIRTGQIAAAQGTYEEVTDADIVTLRLNHYFTADDKHHDPDFEWTFTKEGFAIKEGTGKIPDYLLEKILSKGRAAKEIRGEWKLKDGKLVLSALKADGKAVEGEASLPSYRTASTVVRIGDVQHVFAVGR